MWAPAVIESPAEGCKLQARLVESAWAEAKNSKLKLSANHPQEFDESELQAICRNPCFLPAWTLDQSAA